MVRLPNQLQQTGGDDADLWQNGMSVDDRRWALKGRHPERVETVLPDKSWDPFFDAMNGLTEGGTQRVVMGGPTSSAPGSNQLRGRSSQPTGAISGNVGTENIGPRPFGETDVALTGLRNAMLGKGRR